MWGVVAKIDPSMGSFDGCAEAPYREMGQETGEKWAAAVTLRPTRSPNPTVFWQHPKARKQISHAVALFTPARPLAVETPAATFR